MLTEPQIGDRELDVDDEAERVTDLDFGIRWRNSGSGDESFEFVCGIHGFITGVEELLRSIVVNLVMLMYLVLRFLGLSHRGWFRLEKN